ncbi:MAG: hypothetical protein BroJett011_71320 [Chloroflexota bacterium]|nr:MAG: hypothetical protein BroJett011_71320 [Chloroflexota bacterium]
MVHPPWVIALTRQVIGDIDLDPANCAAAQQWIQARRFFIKDDNGLRWPWHGRVFLNPPYGNSCGKSNQAVWSSKLIAEYQARRVTEAVLLVNAKLGYDWFTQLLKYWPICLAYERISFINAVTLAADKGPSKQASAFVYFGPNYGRFEAVFSEVGRVLPALNQCL